MSRRRNYGFERRRKAQDRQAKQEGKRQRKADRAEAGLTGPEMGEAPDLGTAPETWEWFSPGRSRTLATPSGTRPETEPPDDWILLTDVKEQADGADVEGEPDASDVGAPTDAQDTDGDDAERDHRGG